MAASRVPTHHCNQFEFWLFSKNSKTLIKSTNVKSTEGRLVADIK